jgi:hypothetical protein
MSKTFVIVATLSLTLMAVLSVTSSTQTVDISERDIAARVTVEGFKPFEFRGWRVDFIEDGGISGDCPWVIGYWGATARRGTETRYFKVAHSDCDGFYVSVRPVKSTDRESAYRSPAGPGITRIEKPNFTAFDVFQKGCVIHPYGGMGWASWAKGKASQGTFVDVTLLNTNQRWGYRMEVSGEKITLTREEQQEVYSLKENAR